MTKNNTFLSAEQLAARYDVHVNSVHRWQRTNASFPKAVKLSAQCTRWRLSDILEWEDQSQEEVA